MCDFPSWIVDESGKAHWLKDADVKRAIEDGAITSWLNSCGHKAIERICGVKGTHCEGRRGIPEEFASAIRAGECNRMALADPACAVKHALDLLPPGLIDVGAMARVEICGSPLETLPALPSCTELYVDNCPVLRELPACTRLHVYNCPALRALPALPACTWLDVDNCPALRALPELPACTRLHVYDCPEVRALPSLPRWATIYRDGKLVTQ